MAAGKRGLSRWRWGFLAAAAVAAAVVGVLEFQDRDRTTSVYRFATIARGNISSIVTATGTVNPVVNVQVGSQVSGQIKELRADFNTPVKAGQIIARIDPGSFEARVMEARAEVAYAKANVKVQQAIILETEASIRGAEAALAEAERDHRRKQALLARRVASASTVDKALSARDQAKSKLDGARAKLRRQRAQLETAAAQVELKQATLRYRELDLEHTIIRSPIDGVVTNRQVDVGQTVAAALQAPVLFTIAKDLRQMQVEVSVDEADIGRVRVGQKVTFTVDAYPRRTFTGVVGRIRKVPKVVSNVVTYTVVVSAANEDLGLLPGMTANVNFIVGQRRNVLKVANKALRFRPRGAPAAARTPAVAAPGDRRAAARRRVRALLQRLTKTLDLNALQRREVVAVFRRMGPKIGALRRQGGPPREMRNAIRQLRRSSQRRIAQILNEEQRRKYRALLAAGRRKATRPGRVWVLGAGGEPKPVAVVLGLSDGSATAIVRGPIKAGDRVIVGEVEPDDD